MTVGQSIGALCGHLLVVVGALLFICAIGRFWVVGNAPDQAVVTVVCFIYAAGLEGFGKILLWFSGTDS